MSLLHQHALIRLSFLRFANIGSWLALLLYLGFHQYQIHPSNFYALATYAVLATVGLWCSYFRSITERSMAIQLILEVGLLAALLFLSGGAANPLISYYLILILLAAYALPLGITIIITLLCIFAYSGLMHWRLPLASNGTNNQHLFDLHLLGMWLNFVVSAGIFAALIPMMLKSREQQRQEIQRLREQQLKNEQLIGIATLAAGTAHEMGTPLMTMQMLLNERNANTSLSEDDLQILAHQVERCRQSLKRLASAGREVQNINQQAANTWLKELLERWRLSHPKAQWQDKGLSTNACIVVSPLLDQALLNLLDNAAEAGEQAIELSCRLERGFWQLHIIQPDHQAADNLQQRHQFTSDKEHGLGLGLYLSNASVEQFGGSIHLQAQADGSSLCVLALPLCDKPQCTGRD